MGRGRWIGRRLLELATLCAGLAGCTFVDSMVDKTSQVAGEMVGQVMGERVGTAAVANLPPEARYAYVSGVFQSFFYVGGYQLGEQEYRPGEWTRWQVSGSRAGEQYEKAFLKRDDQGREWWRLATKSEDDGEVQEVVLEALLAPAEGGQERRLVRMRGLFPGDDGPAELPVQENTSAWYSAPVTFTEESMEGATEGVESVTTPAGTFEARHLVYRTMQGTAQWWLSEQVPGELVKYRVGSPQEADAGYSSELVAYGSDATTRLGSF